MTEGFQELKGRIYRELLECSTYYLEIEDNKILEQIDEKLEQLGKEQYISVDWKIRLRKEIFQSLRKLDVLQDLIEDSEITEIMINGPDCIFIEKKGELLPSGRNFSSPERLEDIIQIIVGCNNRRVNMSNPIADARLENGSRVNIILSPVALNGPVVTIRRFPDQVITMEQLIAWNSISEEAAFFLQQLVRAGYNIFISGGTGSGKTTFLNALSNAIPKEERIITIEDNAELQIQGIQNLVRLETRQATMEGDYEISIRDLLKTSLRCRPDRIIVGEIRGPEALDMLQSLNTGHDGSLSTGHANSSRDMLYRLETMVLMGMDMPIRAIRRQIASGIDIIVHLGRLRDKTRRVLEVTEIIEFDGEDILTSILYQFEEKGENNGKVNGILEAKNPLVHQEKLKRAGLKISL